VTANAGSAGTVSVLRGQSGGTFAAAISYAVASTPVYVRAGDLNNDGRLDIVTANESPAGTISVLRGRVGGGFDLT
jgi:hypothetical protein